MVVQQWAILGGRHRVGGEFLYYGTWRTRKDAIEAHKSAFGERWDVCSSKGDRAVRVWVSTTPIAESQTQRTTGPSRHGQHAA